MTKREHVLEYQFVGLRRHGPKTARVETPAQHVTQPLGSIEPLTQQIALPPRLRHLGIETPSAGQPRHEVAQEKSEPVHSRP